MHKIIRRWPLLMALMALSAAQGCGMFESWRIGEMNGGPALDVGDAYFSVSDPAATLPEESAD